MRSDSRHDGLIARLAPTLAPWVLGCAAISTLAVPAIAVATPAPTVTIHTSVSTIASGGTATLTWSTTNAEVCEASGAWSGVQNLSGSVTGRVTATSTYTLTCTGTGGKAAQSATISIAKPAPSITLAANPSTVASGVASVLSWSSTNATSCIGSANGWSGTEPTSGSQSTPALTATTKYTLTCTGTGGTASQSVTVSVKAATTAPSTGTATLSWSAPSSNTNGTALTPLTGYTLYYGTTQDSLTHSITVSGASSTEYEITGLTSGTWYFAVAADASDGTQSAMSAIGSKTI